MNKTHYFGGAQMKKRILALILCVLMVLPVFAGCAKTEAEKSKNADEEISETSIHT